MKHIIYQISNTVNGKIYIGAHSTENINDSYMGSGIAIRQAIKKYGIESFAKDILHVFDTREEMYEKEREIVSLDFVNRPDTYNMGVGGMGGPMLGMFHSEEKKQEISQRTIQMMTEEIKSQMSVSCSKRSYSEETNQKRSQTNKALYHGSAMDRTGKTITEAHRKRISKPVSINGVVYESGSIAASALGLSRSGFDYRLKSDKYPDWMFI